MKHLLLAIAVAVPLSGCIQPDDLVSDEVAEARQNLRLQSYQSLDCEQLNQQWIALSPVRSLLVGFLAAHQGPYARQTLGDIEEMMRRKGCALPEGV